MRYVGLWEVYAEFAPRDFFVGIVHIDEPSLRHLVEEAKHIRDVPNSWQSVEHMARLCKQLSFPFESPCMPDATILWPEPSGAPTGEAVQHTTPAPWLWPRHSSLSGASRGGRKPSVPTPAAFTMCTASGGGSGSTPQHLHHHHRHHRHHRRAPAPPPAPPPRPPPPTIESGAVFNVIAKNLGQQCGVNPSTKTARTPCSNTFLHRCTIPPMAAVRSIVFQVGRTGFLAAAGLSFRYSSRPRRSAASRTSSPRVQAVLPRGIRGHL
ncbi:hypothetical protein B0T25DRAFT_54110 [Lasiosphaeria hispida]|uniref:Uncharacterized protein n=1 Tax=Lasiosphaeria hispida TaxID=260671 RepID=A0AAJ0MKH1_9PEZI|nr:hypothetical protein B0T25DRAFT_54110 [Lasiosphaeria hispida]